MKTLLCYYFLYTECLLWFLFLIKILSLEWHQQHGWNRCPVHFPFTVTIVWYPSMEKAAFVWAVRPHHMQGIQEESCQPTLCNRNIWSGHGAWTWTPDPAVSWTNSSHYFGCGLETGKHLPQSFVSKRDFCGCPGSDLKFEHSSGAKNTSLYAWRR